MNTKPINIKKPVTSPLSKSVVTSPPFARSPIVSPSSSFTKTLLQKEGSFEKLKKQYDINVEDIATVSGVSIEEVRLSKALDAMKTDEDIEEDIAKIG